MIFRIISRRGTKTNTGGSRALKQLNAAYRTPTPYLCLYTGPRRLSSRPPAVTRSWPVSAEAVAIVGAAVGLLVVLVPLILDVCEFRKFWPEFFRKFWPV